MREWPTGIKFATIATVRRRTIDVVQQTLNQVRGWHDVL
jgi:hypothetical protein